MCGITGIFYKNKIANTIATEKSCKAIALRGPDGQGIVAIDNICLGHRRLSIIDPSIIANQPMYDISKKYCIIFNGEIFNFQELKQAYLLEKKITFSTHSDTEVLLYLLIHYGEKCLTWLDGFFSFAFYDIESQSLLLARDRFGKKPLLYYHNEDFFAFASEMKALLCYDIKKEINFSALNHYFQFTYTPQTESVIKNVKKLQAGHFAKIQNNIISISQYFKLEINKSAYDSLDYSEAKQKLVELFDKAVTKRLISDVPLGAFLSGGIDSSAVVAMAATHTKHLNTFSIGYKDNPFYDETKYANLVSKKYNTEHTVFYISNKDYLDVIDDILNYIDEPYADSSSIPLYILARNTKKANITVALSGDGGDELFAGYNKHFAEKKLRNPTLFTSTISALHPLWKLAPQGRNASILNKFRQLNKFSINSKLNNKERYISLASFNQHSKKLFKQNILSEISEEKENIFYENLTKNIQTNDLNEFLLTDFNFVLYNDMLVKVDLMGMANSLEIRSPFLDKDIVDFAFQIPENYKIDNKLKKKIVQDAFRDKLPEELYNRPKKGFEIPLNNLLQNELWQKIDEEYLEEQFIIEQNIFDIEHIRFLKNKMKSKNPEDTYITIWALIVFQHWYKKYFL